MKFLDGITIIDFSRLLPGPLGTKILQEYGAKVIKLENGKNGDWLKYQPPLLNGQSVYYSFLNAEKEIRVLDFKDPVSKNEIHGLIETADVIIEQFRPGVLASIGFGFEACKRLCPDVVYLSLTGYGQTCGKKMRAGHDLNYLAESGILSEMKEANGKPILPGVQWGDIAAGSFPLVTACFSGLYYRMKTGNGIFIDVSIVDNLDPFTSFAKVRAAYGQTDSGLDFLTGGYVNYNVYQTGDGQWMALAALELKFWNLFCQIVRKNEWKRDHPGDLCIRKFDKRLVEDIFQSQDFTYWDMVSSEYDICLSPIISL